MSSILFYSLLKKGGENWRKSSIDKNSVQKVELKANLILFYLHKRIINKPKFKFSDRTLPHTKRTIYLNKIIVIRGKVPWILYFFAHCLTLVLVNVTILRLMLPYDKLHCFVGFCVYLILHMYWFNSARTLLPTKKHILSFGFIRHIH